MELKFDLDDQVKIKGTDKVGTIKSIKVDIHKINDKREVVVKYYVQTGLSYQREYYQEHHLEFYPSYEFDNTFELGLVDMLIDIYLHHKKLDIVEKLFKDKQQYM